MPSSAWATAPTSPAAADAVPSPALAPAPEADPLIEPRPEPTPAGQAQLPGNLEFSVEDFFGGLVRRIERRP